MSSTNSTEAGRVAVVDREAAEVSSRPLLSPTRGSRNGALDGLRGLAVTAVMAYHVVPDPFTGGWLGVDIFFVLSGFLICSMLLRERARTRTIDYKRFLIRRARRLLPGLALMLLAVLAAAMVWESSGRRKTVAIDVMSSMLQFSNWRLILADESYFATVGVPSPIRHTWSLGVQEQFYFVFPLVLLVLFNRAKLWRTIVIVFGVLAAISVWRMVALYTPGTDPSRVYFGTDSRLSELLIGVIGAIVLHQRVLMAKHFRMAGPRSWSPATERLIGWLGLGSLVLIGYWMFTVDEFSPWLFQGGLILIAVITMVLIAAATAPITNAVTRLLSGRWLMRAGDMSYSLYIWHWPIIVYLAPALPGASEVLRQVLAVALTIMISWVSYTFVENPIHRHGLRGWIVGAPTRGPQLATLAALLIVAGSAVLYSTTGSASSNDLAVKLPADPSYGVEPGRLDPGVPRHEVVLVGASTVVGLADRGETDKTADISLRPAASLGCTPYQREERTSDGLRPEGDDCADFRKRWATTVAESNNATVVLFVMTRMFTDFEVDGRRVSPPSAEYEEVVRGVLEEFATTSYQNGAARIGIVNMSCHSRVDLGGDVITSRSNDFETTKYLNSIIDAFAADSGAAVYDMYSLLCPQDKYFDSINGEPLYDDGLHFSTQSAPIIWQWLAHEVRRHAASDEEQGR